MNIESENSNNVNRQTLLLKRIKRYVNSQFHRIKIIVSPGLEQVCAKELSSFDVYNVVIFQGRIECSVKIESVYKLNLLLRTAERILLILKNFKVRTIEDLFNKTHSIYWELYLKLNVNLKISVKIFQTFISSQNLVKATVEKAVNRRLKEFYNLKDISPKNKMSKQLPQMITVYGKKRDWTISIDTSGELLHKRGYRLAGGIAPINETLASGILYLGGYDYFLSTFDKNKQLVFVDGMTGSGTLAIEAALMAASSPHPVHRYFAFMEWISFREKTWNFIFKKTFETKSDKLDKIIALDINMKQLEIAKMNAQRAELIEKIIFLNRDFFQTTPSDLDLKNGFLVLNPPYGKRIAKNKIKRFYYHLGNHLRKNFTGWTIVLIYPADNLEKVIGLTNAKYYTLSSGGYKIRILVTVIAAS